MKLKTITAMEMIQRYKVLFFDAYGVLVNESGAIDGASELIAHLNAQKKPYMVLTNDASRLVSTSAKRYQRLGLEITQEQVITSGSLLPSYISQHELQGARAVMMGTPDSMQYGVDAGLELLELEPDTPAELFVLGELGSTGWQGLEVAVSMLINLIEDGQRPTLILPNPDLIYPKSNRSFGITAGGAASMIETILHERYAQDAPKFVRLGKPHAFIYEDALRRTNFHPSEAIMVGDQLATDVKGAMDVGLDAALVTTGLTTTAMQNVAQGLVPTWVLESFSLE